MVSRSLARSNKRLAGPEGSFESDQRRALAARHADKFDLTISQWRVMAVLGRESGLSANQLVERTAMDKVAVSRAVVGFERLLPNLLNTATQVAAQPVEAK